MKMSLNFLESFTNSKYAVVFTTIVYPSAINLINNGTRPHPV